MPKRGAGEAAVLDVLRQYQAAFTRMDVSRIRSLWPAADRQALAETFGATSEHRLTLDRCTVDVAEQRATTRCNGALRSRPRRSDVPARVVRGTWTFELAHDANRWTIVSVARP